MDDSEIGLTSFTIKFADNTETTHIISTQEDQHDVDHNLILTDMTLGQKCKRCVSMKINTCDKY